MLIICELLAFEIKWNMFTVDITDIQRVVAGGEGDFPMSSTKGKKNSNVRGITLEVGDKPDLYHLVTFDEETINAWCDGINALIGNSFTLFFSHPNSYIFSNVAFFSYSNLCWQLLVTVPVTNNTIFCYFRYWSLNF